MLYRVHRRRASFPRSCRRSWRRYEVVAPVKRGRSYAFRGHRIVRRDRARLSHDHRRRPRSTSCRRERRCWNSTRDGNQVTDFAAGDHAPRVIFGAHACDINALNRLDLVFKDGRYPDPYYVARRGATLVVGDELHCPPRTCFCHLVGTPTRRATGYDLFLQDIGGKYLVSISSVEAANILEAACDPRVATDEDRIAVPPRHAPPPGGVQPRHPRHPGSRHAHGRVPQGPVLGRAGRHGAFPARRARRCAPPASASTSRTRCDPDGTARAARARVGRLHVAAVRAGGGRPQLPSPTGASRVRHRMYHKLNGFLANHDRMLCVGCGRCVDRLQGGHQPHRGAEVLREEGGRRCRVASAVSGPSRCGRSARRARARSSGAEMMAANPYRPWPARITSITDLTATEKLFEFRLIDERIRDAFSHEPGQFVGAVASSAWARRPSPSPARRRSAASSSCAVRRAGAFTEALHRMQCGDIVGLRGPFGRGVPLRGHEGPRHPAGGGRPGDRAPALAHQQHPRRAQRVRQGHHHLRVQDARRGDVPRPVRDVAPPQATSTCT